mgnify:CR=1 FL=1
MKPIIFSTPMVQAILDGRKTQTRRVIKPQPVKDDTFEGPYWYEPTVVNKDGELGPGKPVFGISSTDGEWGIKSPYQPGDILWVRETWATVSSGIIEYKATYIEPYTGSTEIDHIGKKITWRPSIHMPREAARIFLQVKNVRVERLQDITEEDAKAEGCHERLLNDGWKNIGKLTARDDFIMLWEYLNAKRGYGWDTNPWVWVIEFERITKEEAERLEGIAC